jgi:hypothetical protein
MGRLGLSYCNFNLSLISFFFLLNLFVVAAGRSHAVLAQLLLAGLEAPVPLHKGWSIHGGSLCLTVLQELWIADGLGQVEGGCGDLGWFGKCSP